MHDPEFAGPFSKGYVMWHAITENLKYLNDPQVGIGETSDISKINHRFRNPTYRQYESSSAQSLRRGHLELDSV